MPQLEVVSSSKRDRKFEFKREKDFGIMYYSGLRWCYVGENSSFEEWLLDCSLTVASIVPVASFPQNTSNNFY